MTGRPRLLAAALVLLTGLAYLPALRAGFIWDDDHYVTGNRLLSEPGGLRRIWASFETPQYYPMVFTSFWVERRLWDLEPVGYHAVNVLLHAANALMAVLLLRRLPMRGAWLAGLLFALHPVHVESVAWITERKNVLSGCFYLMALGAFWRCEDGGGRRWYAAALGLFALALLSKTVTATLPAALLLLRWLRRRPLHRRFLLSLAPFLVLGALMGSLTAWVEVRHARAQGPEWDFSLAQRAVIAGRALPFYLRELAWPARLVFVQYPRVVPGRGLSSEALWPLGAVLVLAGSWLVRDRIGRGVPAAAGFFTVTLLPALGFLNIYPMRYSFVADHYQYLASLGPIALVAAAASGLPRAVLAAPLVALGVLTFRQAGVYRTPETLWRDVLDKNPRSWLAHDCLGRILANRGEVDEALAHYRSSLEVKSDDFYAHNALGILLSRLDRPREALPHLLEAVRLNPQPGYDEPWTHLERCWRDGLKHHPDDPRLHFNLGWTLRHLKRTAEAEDEFRKALALDPGLEKAREALGRPR